MKLALQSYNSVDVLLILTTSNNKLLFLLDVLEAGVGAVPKQIDSRTETFEHEPNR